MSEESVPLEEETPPVEQGQGMHPFMLIAIGVGVIAGIGFLLKYLRDLGRAAKERKRKAEAAEAVDDVTSTNTVGLKDITYLVAQLNPKSTHMDVLMAIASTPENIAYGLAVHKRTEKMRRDRITDDLEEAKKSKEGKKAEKASTNSSGFLDLDDDGWADDEEDDEKAKAAKEAEAEKAKAREELKKAVGKNKIKLEGIDAGVVGQKWVEKVLGEKGIWPPTDLGLLKGRIFEYEGKQVAPLDHPGLRRNLLMITGRLNSLMLNTHTELLQAGKTQAIDQTYFKGSMEFRQRCALLLEASLRTAVACRNYDLAKTIVETVGIFKIGTSSPSKTEWFDNVMKKQYAVLPRLKIENTFVECTGEKDMATGDILAIGLELTRTHAEAFTRQKIAMFQKQGIPPQVALQTYREGWWFLARAERLDGDSPAGHEIKTDGLLKEVAASDLAKFQSVDYTEQLLTAWPMIVQNVAQKSGKVKIQFKAPEVPGKYRFTVSVKSQDFLGADEEFSVEGTVVDASTVVRKPKEDKKDDESKESEDPQAKKDN